MQKLFITILVLCISAAALAADGDLDPSFNLTGYVNESFYGNVSRIRSLAIQPDGKIIAAGNAADSLFLNDFSIIRYNPNGSIDTSFGTAGRIYADINGRPDVSPIVLLQSDGKIVVVGNSQDNQNNLLSVLRFNANGSADSTFGTNGVTTTRFEPNGSSAATPNDAILQPDGKIVVAGGWTGTAFCVARFNTNGSVDSGFGSAGSFCATTVPVGTGTMNAVALQSDGKIVTAGRFLTSFNSPSDGIVFRFTAGGALDTSFDSDGYRIIDFDANYDELSAVEILPDGKIVTLGRAGVAASTLYRFGLARLNSNGSPDNTFDGDGKATAFAESTPGTERYSLARLANGKLIAARWRRQPSPQTSTEAQLARFNADGSPDSTFGTGGLVTNSVLREVWDIARQSDGKIVAAGWNQNTQSVTARFLNADTATPAVNPAMRIADFDGDGKSDASVFRAGIWYVNPSSSPSIVPAAFYAVQFGLAGDKLAPADYDGDGKTDVAVWRENVSGSQAYFYILRSSDNTVTVDPFGLTGDKVTSGDYDGDGKADLATFRDAPQATFFYRGSLNNPGGSITYVPFGISGDRPVRGDFDGDGRLDAAVFRPASQTWFILRSSDAAVTYTQFGLATDRPVSGDFDGDGKSDITVFRDGVWYVLQSSNGQVRYLNWGIGGDAIVAGDYDGDGKTDPAVFRNGVFFVLGSAGSQTLYLNFGASGDLPAAAAFGY